MALGTAVLLLLVGLRLSHSSYDAPYERDGSHVDVTCSDIRHSHETSRCSNPVEVDGIEIGLNLLQRGSVVKPTTHTTEVKQSMHEKAQISLRPPGRKDLTFIHIPKTGGTAIEVAGRANGLVWGEPDAGWMAVGMRGESCNPRHVPPHMHPADYSNRETFCIVRDPYSRIISEYRYLRDKLWGDRFGIDDEAKQSCSGGLNSFVQKRLHTYIWYHFENDCHMIPQSDYIWGPDGHQWCHNVLRFEHLDKSFDALMEAHGMPERLTSHNNVAEECPELSASDINNENLVLFNAIYKKDFENLNYSIIPSSAST